MSKDQEGLSKFALSGRASYVALDSGCCIAKRSLFINIPCPTRLLVACSIFVIT